MNHFTHTKSSYNVRLTIVTIVPSLHGASRSRTNYISSDPGQSLSQYTQQLLEFSLLAIVFPSTGPQQEHHHTSWHHLHSCQLITDPFQGIAQGRDKKNLQSHSI